MIAVKPSRISSPVKAGSLSFNNFLSVNLKLINLSALNIQQNISTTDMFRLDSGLNDENKKLLVVTNDEKIKNYNFKESNRLPVKVTFNPNGGKFTSNTDEETVVKSKERYYIEPSKYNDIEQTIKEDIKSFGTLIREGCKLIEWEMSKAPTSKFDMMPSSFHG